MKIYPSGGRTAKPLKGYVAVQPDKQFSKTKSGLHITSNPVSMFSALQGTVLCVADDIDEVAPGDRVLYSAGSAHKSHDAAVLDAEWFGGEKGEVAVLIPLHKRGLRDVHHTDLELQRIQKRIDELQAEFRETARKNAWLVPKWVSNELGRLRSRKNFLEKLRVGARRNRSKKVLDDTARTEGILGVLETDEVD